MKTTYSLSSLSWQLAGYNPFNWRLFKSDDIRTSQADFPAIPASVPGSVQGALLKAGVLPDWNQGLNSLQCEWVENRHWIYQTDLPDEWLATHGKPGCQIRLKCLGLDDRGWVLVNGKEVATFCGGFVPHTFDLTPYVTSSGNRLQIIFDLPPRWLGQIGYTSRMTEWKARFNYSWDWTARLVQIGIWDDLLLEVSDGGEIERLKCITEVDGPQGKGTVRVSSSVVGGPDWQVQVSLTGPQGFSRQVTVPIETFNQVGVLWAALPVQLWWPNGQGAQPLYILTCRLVDAGGRLQDEQTRTLGFKHITWQACEGAPAGADPWVCVVNGQPLFLQGINWTPIRPNYADTTEADYRKLLEMYRALGCNVLRVWGGAVLEKACFYRLCDEMGFLLWQEFPLSSSGLDNWPPDDAASIAALETIARSYIERRQHHVSLFMWCGGNELQQGLDGGKEGVGKPLDGQHPLLGRLAQIAAEMDPGRRFVATSSLGPRFSASPEDFGKGLHWDVHGPWRVEGDLEQWSDYWANVDALFHSEVGAAGASSTEVIRKYSGGLPLMPASGENPLWRRTLWWVEWADFLQETGNQTATLEEFVAWSQSRQAKALECVARSLKAKFPRCGGVILWMGHDSFPCTSNTSIIDFDGNLKPAATALKQVFWEHLAAV